MFGYFKKLAEVTDQTLKIEDHDFLVTDDHAVALFKIKATRAETILDAKYCEIVHWRDGRVVEDWGFAYDQYAFDEFWSSSWSPLLVTHPISVLFRVEG